jgi:hypothetical protein
MTAYRTSPLAVATIAPRTTWTRLLRAWWRGTLRKMQLRRDGWCAACRNDHCCANQFAGSGRMLGRRIRGDCRCTGGRELVRVGERLEWRHQGVGTGLVPGAQGGSDNERNES